MAIFPLFSKKQKLLRGELPDVYTYNIIPKPLRVQIFHLLRESIGIYQHNYHSSHDQKINEYYTTIRDILCKEYGYYQLANGDYPDVQVFNFLDQEQDVEKVLDLIQISFFLIDTVIRQDYSFYREAKIKPDEAIAELNHRFHEHGIGYQYEAGKIIRVDSTYMHSEILKPTLKLIWNKKFAGPNEEYLKAHEHYRHGRNKECLVECLKAFESTMKTICSIKGWSYKPKGTAKDLIKACIDNKFIPAPLQNQFYGLNSMMESGIPTVRNNYGGHGQGSEIEHATSEMTRYCLNLTGANIILLVELSGIK